MLPHLFDLPWWGYVLYGLVLTQITIACVTIYLHRAMAHESVALHPVVSHLMRFWLWLTTGMNTQEWVATHRKHHAYADRDRDPHSPLNEGIWRMLFLGAVVYSKAANDKEMLQKYGKGCPDDWIERNFYTPLKNLGIVIMLGINVALFGPMIGAVLWVVQMAWIPFWAAGVINGAAHYIGYINYKVKDNSRNLVPWGLFIGGEELHNNHHRYLSSARFSARPWEIDIGWVYIRILSWLRLAKVRMVAPKYGATET
ncbi:MAG: acyl-CoA desaturase [Thiohalorhabdaceae bacterium]